ncbi:MAG: TonB-dependent receptor plug domain-containing protein [Muribaculaceae bacterium]|nr:TonB-dependent receptor plug domain-containing protein [Muribaculaceae bacterium]
MKQCKTAIVYAISALLSMQISAASVSVSPNEESKDTLMLESVQVIGKSSGRRLAEGALTINAVELKANVNRLTNLNDLVNRSAGVKVRREGGYGSDLDLSINGLSGNSIRYFIDGVPLDSKGSEVNLDNIPINMVERVELYKGVVPAHLSSDALGGAVNIVTKRHRQNFLDASYGIGSFHTQTADLTGQFIIPKTAIVVRPTFGLNYSKNDYMMKDVEIWSEKDDKYVKKDLRRFHDDYLSILGQIEVGVNDVKWADAFFITGSYTKIDKEIQTGAIQNKVYGEVERNSHAWNIGMRYLKRWGNVNTRLNLSHTWDHSETVDSAYRKYTWDGSWIPSGGNEMNNRPRTVRIYKRPLTIVNAGVEYTFVPGHNLSFNYMLNRRGNERYDLLDYTFDPSNDIVTKHILSLTYSQNLIDERWQNMFFVKDYINSLSIEQTELPSISGADKIDPHATNSYWGAGIGSRFTLNPRISFKASYEHSVRLPLSRELLGNGTTVYPNLAIKPEQSNNWNIGVFGEWRTGYDHYFTYELNGFIRHVQNYIRAVVSERDGMMQYTNEPAIEVKGLDFDLGYTWRNALDISINGSWNDARNLRKYKPDGNLSATYKNRVPNKPWIFGNVEASYTFRDLAKGKSDRLRLEGSWEWIHWYYLNWEAYGAASSKARIPTQSIFNVSATYSVLDGRYNLSVECDNIFDHLAFDNYMLQKPGRAFHAKLRVFFNDL